jgi:hypothetical protein
MDNWIKRDKRARSRVSWSRIVLWVLFLIVISLLISKFYPSLFKLKSYVNVISDKQPLGTGADIQKVVENILGELRLGKTEIMQQPLTYTKQQADFPVLRMYWPEDFPYVWFTNRVQRELSNFEDIGYFAIESNGGKDLLMYFYVPDLGDTLAEIQLIGSSKVQPELSSIAIIFSNFADFKIEDALSLIWLDIPFGFILVPDQIPGDKLAKALEAGPGQCILEIPAGRDSWELIMKAHHLAGIVKNTDIDRNNMRAVFNAFPVLDGFYFTDSDNPDRELIKLVIDQAEVYRLVYLRHHPGVSYADSLAYLKGMKIKEFNDISKYVDLSPTEIKSLLVHQANDFSKHDKGVYILASRADNIDILKALQPLFERLNIVQVKPLRIAKLVENL